MKQKEPLKLGGRRKRDKSGLMTEFKSETASETLVQETGQFNRKHRGLL